MEHFVRSFTSLSVEQFLYRVDMTTHDIINTRLHTEECYPSSVQFSKEFAIISCINPAVKLV